MRERPIIFSGDMIRAILDGRKTITRRPVKKQPAKDVIRYYYEPGNFLGLYWRGVISEDPLTTTCGRVCPYGQPGDRLWVRETWASRITLEIVNVKVERLQEITIDGLYAEGWDGIKGTDPVDWFKDLWNSLYTKKPELQWEANCWVWVIEFNPQRRE